MIFKWSVCLPNVIEKEQYDRKEFETETKKEKWMIQVRKCVKFNSIWFKFNAQLLWKSFWSSNYLYMLNISLIKFNNNNNNNALIMRYLSRRAYSEAHNIKQKYI